MSGKRENNTNDLSKSSSSIPDSKKDYEESTTIDSGFISSGNIQFSGEIKSEENISSASIGEPSSFENKKEIAVAAAEDDYMRLDSGVDLSESFSGLDLKNSDLNDLSCSKKKLQSVVNPEPPVAVKQEQQEDWKKWYQQDEDGNTYLHIAIAQGLVEAVLALIRTAPHPLLLDTPNDDALTPIHLAAITKQWRIVRWLIVAGAKPSPRNISGDSPLHIAARNGDLYSCRAITEVVHEQEHQYLALNYSQQAYQPANLDQWNYEGQTCVHVAALGGHIDVLRYLVWYGADINARDGTSGFTALHYSIQNGNDHLTQFLLMECKKLNVGTATYGGRSALQLGFPVSNKIEDALRLRGVASSFSADEYSDTDESDSDSEYENTMFVQNLVDTSA